MTSRPTAVSTARDKSSGAGITPTTVINASTTTNHPTRRHSRRKLPLLSRRIKFYLNSSRLSRKLIVKRCEKRPIVSEGAATATENFGHDPGVVNLNRRRPRLGEAYPT